MDRDLLPTGEANRHEFQDEIERIANMLESTITECLGGPGGDPDPHHCQAAMNCVVLLEAMGYDVHPDIISDNRYYYDIAKSKDT